MRGYFYGTTQFDDPDRKKFLELSARTLAEKRGIFQHGTRIIIISLKTAR